MSKEEYKGAIEVSVIFHEGQRMFAVPKQVVQQEPVECANGCRGFVKHFQPAQRKPLTDEEIKQFASKHLDVGDGSYATHFVTGDVAFARAIEAAHNIKENT
jgi:hypothetical protein